jgi:hypothetical protein
MKALGFENPPCLVATSIRLSNSGSSRAARIRTFRFAILGLLNSKPERVECVTRDVQRLFNDMPSVLNVERPKRQQIIETTQNLYNNPFMFHYPPLPLILPSLRKRRREQLARN